MDIMAVMFKPLSENDVASVGNHSRVVDDLRRLADQLEANPKMNATITATILDPSTNLTTIYSGHAGDTYTGSEAYAIESPGAEIFNLVSTNISISFDDRQASGNAFDINDNTLDIWFGPSRDDETNLISVEVPNEK